MRTKKATVSTLSAGTGEPVICVHGLGGTKASFLPTVAARNIYLDEPDGDDGFWTRLGGLECDTMFVWGRSDTLVPIAFMKHVERTLSRARHVELDCGHVPQLKRPIETHAAIREFLGAG